MTPPSVQQEISKELERLPIELQQRVLEYTRALGGTKPEGQPGKELLRFAGLIDADTARTMLEAIEAGCERVDPNDW